MVRQDVSEDDAGCDERYDERDAAHVLKHSAFDAVGRAGSVVTTDAIADAHRRSDDAVRRLREDAEPDDIAPPPATAPTAETARGPASALTTNPPAAACRGEDDRLPAIF